MAGDAQAALLAHIASQTKSNINFLISQNYISPQDVEGLTAKLTALEDSPRRHNNVQPIAERNRQSTMNMNGGNSDGSWQGRAQSPPRAVMPTRRPVPPPQTRPQQARALWDYGDSSVCPVISVFNHPEAKQKQYLIALADTDLHFCLTCFTLLPQPYAGLE